MMDFRAARLNMVESQIRPNKVTDPAVVAAMSELPREEFLPKNLRGIAYVDEDVPIGGGRYLMEPMILARLLQAAEIRPSDVVLDIAAGTGYDAAVLARLATTIVALECDPALAAQAGKTLGEHGIDNAVVVEGSLELGYPRQAPYDVIVIGGAVEEVPPAIIAQLAPSGRLVAVVASPGEPGRAILVSRLSDTILRRVLFDASTGVLPGFHREPGFVF
jgi:protein-L-isoaspartate(D-aspartate) O-methyltransferase